MKTLFMLLSYESMYSPREIMNFWKEYKSECEETETPLDIDYFIGVTTENDW